MLFLRAHELSIDSFNEGYTSALINDNDDVSRRPKFIDQLRPVRRENVKNSAGDIDRVSFYAFFTVSRLNRVLSSARFVHQTAN